MLLTQGLCLRPLRVCPAPPAPYSMQIRRVCGIMSVALVCEAFCSRHLYRHPKIVLSRRGCAGVLVCAALDLCACALLLGTLFTADPVCLWYHVCGSCV